MKKIKIITIIIFILLVMMPIVTFNRENEAVSVIDNRELATNPFSTENRAKEGYDLTESVEAYVNDRIGLRDKMILSYTVLNDRLFGKMVHPTYTYGRDGYIFFKMPRNQSYGDYQVAFADMVKKIQDYCEERNVPFLFVFNPSKISVLSEHLPAGVAYDNTWVDQFMDALDVREINYISNMELLKEKNAAGEAVFNQKYDAGHWNDLGAYYGVNHLLEALKKDIPQIHLNELAEFQVSEKLETTLPVSEFPIHENVPEILLKAELEDKTADYSDEVDRHPSYRGFGYYINKERLKEGSPKTLVFQGSYMNGRGAKYLQNSLGEYINVHDYQNVINFPYYFNIFKPDCVIFEVAEYTFSNGYFDSELMKKMSLNPPLFKARKSFDEFKTVKLDRETTVSVEQGKQLTKIRWTGAVEAMDSVWLLLGEQEFDMLKSSTSDIEYEATVENTIYNENKNKLIIVEERDSKAIIHE